MRYTIRAGDTLSGLVRRFNLKITWQMLFDMNRDNISSGDPHLIRIGEIIDIPEEPKNEEQFPLLSSARDDEVILFLNDRFYSSWDAYSYSTGLANLCSTFSLSSTPSASAMDIKPNSLCYFSIGQRPLGIFYAEKIATSISSDSFSYVLSGRSKGLDIVDSSPLTNRTVWNNERIEVIIEELIQPFGFSLNTNGIRTAVLKEFKIEQGETIFDAISKELKKRKILITDTPFDRLDLFRISDEQPIVIREGEQRITSMSADFDFSNRFSEYVVLGQDRKRPSVRAIVNDNAIDRKRRKTFIPEERVTTAEANDRAAWERSLAQSASTNVTVKLSDWRRSDGRLWNKGDVVRIESTSLNIQDNFLVKSVSRNYSKEANDVQLTLVPPEVYIDD